MTNALEVSKTKITHISTYGLILFFALLPFEYPMLNFGVGSILKYVGIGTMGLALYDCMRDVKKTPVDYRSVLLVLWLLFAYSSFMWTIDERGYNLFFGMYRNNALMFLFITFVKYDRSEAKYLKNAYIIGVAFLILYMTFVPGAVVRGGLEMRLTLADVNGEELIDQNYLVAILSVPYAFVLYEVLDKTINKKAIVRVLEIVFCVFCLYYTLMTGSRSGLLTVGIITIFCLLMHVKKNISTVLILLIIFVVSLPFIMSLLPEEIMGRFTMESMTGNTRDSGLRGEIWKDASASLNHGGLLFGKGAGSSMEAVRLEGGKYVAIHNYFLAHIVELGVFGLIIFTSMIIIMLMELYKKGCKDVCIAFCGIIVESIFLDVLPTKFFWGSLILMTVYISSRRRRE